MRHAIHISEVRFHSVDAGERERGLLGFVSCVLNGGVRVDGLALRRTLDGRLALSFPERRDGDGRPRSVVRPIDNPTRIAIEQQIFAALPGAIEEGAR